MFHLKDRFFLKPQLGVFNVLVLQLVVLLLLLTRSCGGQSLVAMLGDDIILPFHLQPAEDASDVTVVWARPDLHPNHVHVRRDNKDFLISQNPQYIGRTSVNKTRVKCGDVSLKLYKVKVSDAGTYRCVVPNLDIDFTVQLVVGSVSSPALEIYIDSSELVCKSKGWYPEPEVLWLDSEGNLLSAGPTETVRGPDYLYTVSSTVTVEKTDSNSFTCRVQQRDINQTRENDIHVPDDFFIDSSGSSARIIISLVVCFTCVFIVGLVVWKIKKNKFLQDKAELENKQKTTLNNFTELQLLVDGEGHIKHLMTESENIKYLDVTKARLEEELKKNDEEMKHVEQIITTLTKQKNDLNKQREKLTSMQQDVKMKIEEKMDKEIPMFDLDKKLQKREDIKQDLRSRQRQYEELLKDTDKLLETTEHVINRMIEKKGKLEKNREQINKRLKETERQRDELQRKLQLEQTEREEEKKSRDSV